MPTIADEIKAVYMNLTPAGVHAVESKSKDAINGINAYAEKGNFQGALDVVYETSRAGTIRSLRQLTGADYTQRPLASINCTRDLLARTKKNFKDLETMAANTNNNNERKEKLLKKAEQVTAALIGAFDDLSKDALDLIAGLEVLTTVDEKSRNQNTRTEYAPRAGEANPDLSGGLETIDPNGDLMGRYVLMYRDVRIKLESAKQVYKLAKTANAKANEMQKALYGIDLGDTLMPSNKYFEFAASRDRNASGQIPSGSGFTPEEFYAETPATGASGAPTTIPTTATGGAAPTTAPPAPATPPAAGGTPAAAA